MSTPSPSDLEAVEQSLRSTGFTILDRIWGDNGHGSADCRRMQLPGRLPRAGDDSSPLRRLSTDPAVRHNPAIVQAGHALG